MTSQMRDASSPLSTSSQNKKDGDPPVSLVGNAKAGSAVDQASGHLVGTLNASPGIHLPEIHVLSEVILNFIFIHNIATP